LERRHLMANFVTAFAGIRLTNEEGKSVCSVARVSPAVGTAISHLAKRRKASGSDTVEECPCIPKNFS